MAKGYWEKKGYWKTCWWWHQRENKQLEIVIRMCWVAFGDKKVGTMLRDDYSDWVAMTEI